MFVFEIQKIKLTLEASNKEELRASKKRKNCINGTILVVYIVGEILYTTLEIATYFTESEEDHETTTLDRTRVIVLLILRVSDFYLSVMFITIIAYYYRRTKDKYYTEVRMSMD